MSAIRKSGDLDIKTWSHCPILVAWTISCRLCITKCIFTTANDDVMLFLLYFIPLSTFDYLTISLTKSYTIAEITKMFIYQKGDKFKSLNIYWVGLAFISHSSATLRKGLRQDPYSRQQYFVQTKLVTESGSINCFSASDYFIFGARLDTCLQIVKLPFSVLRPLSSLSTSQGPSESDLSSSSFLQSSWLIWCLTGELWGDLLC